MSVAFELNAEPRSEIGKGASRRLRRNGRIPAVLYGGGQTPQALSLEHREVLRALENEAFYSHVLQIKLGSRMEQAILRDLQRHPYKPAVLHIDLQRVTAHEKVRVHVPLHFLNEATAIGVKQQGGAVSHFRIEVEVSCLPKDLPEFIEVDLSNLSVGDSISLSQLKLPEGVEIVELAHGTEYDVTVAAIHGQRGGEEEGGVEAGPAGEPSAP